MERYSYLQAMPNSPLSPLTPLNENTKFEFNFGGDGSLDMYINSIRQEHRIEQQQKKLLERANKIFHKKTCPLEPPKRYSQEFLKIRDVFEGHENEHKESEALHVKPPNNLRICCHKEEPTQQEEDMYDITPKAPTVRITHTCATPTPTNRGGKKMSSNDYAATPTNVRTPLKQRNHNVSQNIHSKSYHAVQQLKLQQRKQQQQLQQQFMQHKHLQQQQQQQQGYHNQQHLQPNEKRAFRQASPVGVQPLCPQVAKILNQHGLSMYCGLFQREEIDMYTFHLLRLQDLHKMGISNLDHRAIIMQVIYMLDNNIF